MGVVEWLSGADVGVADADTVLAWLAESRRARACLDAFEVAAAARLDELARVSPSLAPERAVAAASRVPLGDAARWFDRARTIDAVPELGAVLAAGETSAAHVDVVSRALRDLEPEQRPLLAARGQVLAAAAAVMARDNYVRVVRREMHRACTDDGIARLERQRRATRLRTWVDGDTGMWCLRGEFDPETGLKLDRQLRTIVDRLFHHSVPDTCPSDPIAKQQHLRALALAALCDGKAAKTVTEVTVLIDAKTLLDGEHPDSHIDLGLDIDLPIETVRRMACCAEVIVPVITASDERSLHLGRAQRQPNRAQRRALRAMYRCCAIPGCTVAFDNCHIHHLRWWRRFGRTDIENLIPLCHKHHHRVHEGGWNLHLDRYRNLTITYPDGTTMTTGPPTRRDG